MCSSDLSVAGGCDVGCHWCDVKESWDENDHPIIPVKEIVKKSLEFSDCVKGGGVSLGVRGVRQGGEEWSARGVEVVEEAQFSLALERDSIRRRGRALGGAQVVAK